MKTPEFAKDLLRRYIEHSGNQEHRVVETGALKEIIFHARSLFANENNIVNVKSVKGRVVVVGDIHGQLHDLDTLITKGF